MKIFQTKIRKFIRNKGHSIPISRSTNVRVFPKAILRGPWCSSQAATQKLQLRDIMHNDAIKNSDVINDFCPMGLISD